MNSFYRILRLGVLAVIAWLIFNVLSLFVYSQVPLTKSDIKTFWKDYYSGLQQKLVRSQTVSEKAQRTPKNIRSEQVELTEVPLYLTESVGPASDSNYSQERIFQETQNDVKENNDNKSSHQKLAQVSANQTLDASLQDGNLQKDIETTDAFGSTIPQENIYQVLEVLDGDSLLLKGGMIVDLLGVNAPEITSNEKIKKDAEDFARNSETVVLLGAETKRYVESLLNFSPKHEIELKNIQQSNSTGRNEAYVYLVNLTNDLEIWEKFSMVNEIVIIASVPGRLITEQERTSLPQLFLNASLIKAGYAQATNDFEHTYNKFFQQTEEDAKRNKMGFWAK